MKSLVYLFDHRLNLITLLLLFWALFWGLNGLDKFFDGTPEINYAGWASKGSVVDANNKVVYTIQPPNPVGWFGINYEDQTASYFKAIHVSRSVAITLLHIYAILEILLGLLFLILFIWQIMPEHREDKKNFFTDRTLHRIAYKGSVIMFVILAVAYMLFGDRARLWETGTYLTMTLIAYDMWYRTDRFMLELRQKRIAGIDDDDDTNSDQASAYNLKDKRKKADDGE